MRYRVLGRTGLNISELSLGGHEYRRRLNPVHHPSEWDQEEFSKTQPQRNQVIEQAVAAGVNYFDTTLREEALSLGLALKVLNPQVDVYTAAMILDPFQKLKDQPKSKWRELIIAGLEERQQLLQTDWIDIFHIHTPEANYSRDRLESMVEVLRELKAQGKIKAIGASSHEVRFMTELIRKFDYFDAVMIPYNYYQQEAREQLFPVTKALEVGVIVMKPFTWPYYGVPFTRFKVGEVRENPYSPAQTSLRWILRSPEVATIVPGTNTLIELEENLAAMITEEPVNDTILERYLNVAQSPQGKEQLEQMRYDPDMDIQYYAKRTLKRLRDASG